MTLKRIVIMAGGTGGHVFPGLALAQAFARQGVQTHWLGTRAGMEAQWVEQAGLPFAAIDIKGLRGKGLKGWLTAPFNVWRAFWQARKCLKQQAPDLVIGMGGFVCGPGGLAARSLGIPLVLHEQNAIAGLTNRLLAPFAARIFCGFPQQALRGAKVEVVGNPVRHEIEAIEPLRPNYEPSLLVMGGSRGAHALNDLLPQALALIPHQSRPRVFHQAGQGSEQTTRTAYQQAGVEAEVAPFIDNMAQAYQQASLVVARAGALTVSELCAAARPAVLVPFPYAVDDHQTANAQVMQDLDAAVVMAQKDLTPSLLAQAITKGLTEDYACPASSRLHQQAYRGAADKMVDKIMREFAQ